MSSSAPYDAHYDRADSLTRIWDGVSQVIQDNFHRRGAVGVTVTVWSWKSDAASRKHVILESDVFESVSLDLEQVNLILTHLHLDASTEAAFVMAQAIECGLDVDLVYDPATGRLKTPHAVRKQDDPRWSIRETVETVEAGEAVAA